MQSRTTGWIIAGLIGLLAFGIAVYLATNQPAVSDQQPSFQAGCPDDRLALVVPDGNTARVVTDIPLAASIDETHEFHDCQRFITGPKQYGPHVAIFASEQLASLEDNLNAAGSPAIALPAAVIFNYGDKYAPLGLEKGFNCLLLWKEGTTWKAKMVPNGYDEKACLGVFDPAKVTGQDLEIRVGDGGPSGNPNDVAPAVARWDWDGKQQFIGIRCGKEWCDVGAKGFGQSPARKWSDLKTLPGSGNLPPQAEMPPGRIRKGWYDEQRLALKSAAAAGAAADSLEPADQPAVAIPHPALNKHNRPEWYENNWRPAAFVVLPADLPGYGGSPKYWKKGVNKVSLCWESQDGKCVPDAEKPRCDPAWASDDGRSWWAKTTSAGGGENYGCVTRCERSQWVPGTVRWRWQENDEKLWIRCATGCCTVQ